MAARSASSRSLTAAELAWLRVQETRNPAVSTVVLTFDRALDFPCLKTRIEDRLLALDRFRQRIESSRLPLGRPHWREHDQFSLSNHLFVSEEGESERARSLEDRVAELLGRPIDDSHPLWQIHVLQAAEGGSALVARVHQSLADPTAVVPVLLRLADPGREPMSAGALLEGSKALGLEHLIARAELADRVREGASHTRTLCRLISSRTDRHSPFRAKLSGAKTAAWSPALPLPAIEAASSSRNVTASEILLGAIVGALRDELHHRDTPAEGVLVRAIVPLALRETGDPLLGTRMAMGQLRLPLGPTTLGERLAEIRRELERFQRSADDATVLGAEPGSSLSMSEIEERVLHLLGHKATLMVAILDGPPEPVTFCGASLSGLMWWPALVGDLGLGISAVSYRGQVRFGVGGDASVVADADRLAQLLVAAAQKLT